MKAELSFTRSAALCAIAILLIPLSSCQASREGSVQAAQFGSTPHAEIFVQPDEVIRLEGLRFKGGGASLRRNSRAILDAAADILKSEPGKKVYIDAHFDRTGDKRESLQLEQRRAENVKAYLEAQGIPSERMITRGFGPQILDASNSTPRMTRRIPVLN